jgi:small subunit ribosomal protein S27e
MKENILIPQPKSEFYNVECAKCNEKTIVYSHTSKDIYCKSCNDLLAQKSGGKAKILGNIISNLD